MNMDATTIAVSSKIIGLGIKAWKAYQDKGLDEKDLAALNDIVAGAAGMLGGGVTPDAAAAHVGLIMASFGRAFERHWVGTRTLARPGWIKRWFSKEDSRRDDEIQTRMRMARLGPGQPGELAPGEAAIEATTRLLANPLGTPYYRELWRVFTDPQLDIDDGEPPMSLDADDKARFERHFALAYWQALQSAAGKPVRDYLASLEHLRTDLVQAYLLADLALWDERHVFGNVAPDDWNEDERPLPFLPLRSLYIEPMATIVSVEASTRDAPAAPIVGLLDDWLADPRAAKVAVVQADFGMGKSLTARAWAACLAQRRRADDVGISVDAWLPIFIDCGRDVVGESPKLPTLSRRARKRHADELGTSLGIDDQSLAMPAPDQRAVFILDGLDEVVMGQRALDGFFAELRDHATAKHRVLVLSRPGVLPERRELADARVFSLHRFDSPSRFDDPPGGVGSQSSPSCGQIAEWLTGWNRYVRGDRAPIEHAALVKRGLGELAATPILLFMIAYSWDEHHGVGEVSQAKLYETFMLQVARGKHEADRTEHKPVYEAAKALQQCLIDKELLDDSAEPHEAMLWLLARLAWKERCLAWDRRIKERLQRRADQRVGGLVENSTLTRRIIANVLSEELDLDSQAAATIEIGLLLTLQRDPRVNRDRLHFGHKSFREFLVARFWADRLRALAAGRERDWERHAEPLIGGRLLLTEDRSFAYLCKILVSASDKRSSPFAWDRDQREKVYRWAQDRFNDETLYFDSDRERRLLCERSAVLREAALAIGSAISEADDLPGLKATSRWTLRSVLTWFWYTREPVCIYAQKARLQGSVIAGDLRIANFAGADLSNAGFEWCRISRANLQGANLYRANFEGTSLYGANLYRANLEEANFYDARLFGANLGRANLAGANLVAAYLSNANFVGANLVRANLFKANLQGANLQDANLREAKLDGAVYDSTTKWPKGFDPVAAEMTRVD